MLIWPFNLVMKDNWLMWGKALSFHTSYESEGMSTRLNERWVFVTTWQTGVESVFSAVQLPLLHCIETNAFLFSVEYYIVVILMWNLTELLELTPCFFFSLGWDLCLGLFLSSGSLLCAPHEMQCSPAVISVSWLCDPYCLVGCLVSVQIKCLRNIHVSFVFCQSSNSVLFIVSLEERYCQCFYHTVTYIIQDVLHMINTRGLELGLCPGGPWWHWPPQTFDHAVIMPDFDCLLCTLVQVWDNNVCSLSSLRRKKKSLLSHDTRHNFHATCIQEQ